MRACFVYTTPFSLYMQHATGPTTRLLLALRNSETYGTLPVLALPLPPPAYHISFVIFYVSYVMCHVSEVHISWDEPTIAEHDKLRGTRQKIYEPSTPYHYGSGESSTGSDCESAGMVRYGDGMVMVW